MLCQNSFFMGIHAALRSEKPSGRSQRAEQSLGRWSAGPPLQRGLHSTITRCRPKALPARSLVVACQPGWVRLFPGAVAGLSWSSGAAPPSQALAAGGEVACREPAQGGPTAAAQVFTWALAAWATCHPDDAFRPEPWLEVQRRQVVQCQSNCRGRHRDGLCSP